MPPAGTTIRVGDTVVEPTIGICRVQGIRPMTIDGTLEDYFIFQSATAKVLVPRSQMTKRGIRKPMTKDDIKKVNTILRSPVNPVRGDAKTQYLDYQETLKSGDPTRISKLLRNLYILDQSDELKGKEKELMEQARNFLIEEITFIKGDSKTKVLSDINDNLAHMVKKRSQKQKETAKAKTAKAKA